MTDLQKLILDSVKANHEASFPAKEFIPGKTPIRASGAVLNASDIAAMVECAMSAWLTSGPATARFEKEFTEAVGCKSSVFVNSGSSANLLALSALTSPSIQGHLKPGDEVITVAAGFPTTVNPIIQNRLVPVFVDVTLPTYQIDVEQLEAALSPKTRAVMVAHTLGNPFDVTTIGDFCRRHNLWFIEDTCDGLSSSINGRNCGTFGHAATCSFFPAHHVTTGEGGMVMTNRPGLRRVIESFMSWGKSCFCLPGEDNSCGKRFGWKCGELPFGFDHRYIFDHIGYNLKATEMQAALGSNQLKRLPQFTAARKRNFAALSEGLADLERYLVLPEATIGSDPSWFGFPLSMRAEDSRKAMIDHLESHGIGTRMIFAGNLLRQPAYKGIEHRKIGELPVSDFIMRNSFWIGVHPAITEEMTAYMVKTVQEFFA